MLLNLIGGFIGVLLYLFLFWRRLREDYDYPEIFTTGLSSLLGIFIGVIFAKLFINQWWFWLGFSCSLLGLVIPVFRFNLKLTELLEAWVLASLSLVLPLLLTSWFGGGDTRLVFIFVVVAFLILSFFVIDKNYKGFSWYKSGKVGFSGLIVMAALFLTRAIVALIFVDMISFVGMADVYISAIVSFITFSAIFRLSNK